ncbi:MAG TPA: hypothetical protein VIL42_02560 [Sphingomicrobium sp.]|jgi:hypothetical protein
MSVRSFGSLLMVASCAGAALGCYMVSLRVASERAALEEVETRIVLAQRDMRVLQTEIGTRGRLSQLERWNAGAFALSAPSATQFVQSSFELARLTQPEHQVDFQAPVVMASAPAPEPEKAPIGQPVEDDAGRRQASAPGQLIHVASMKIQTREVPARTVPTVPQANVTKAMDKPVTAAKPASPKSIAKPGLAAAKPVLTKQPTKAQSAAVKLPAKKSVDKPATAAAKPVTKPARLAKVDPLAPLPAKQSGKLKDSSPGR